MRRWTRVVILTWMLPACSATGVLNALAPSRGITVTPDIAYAAGDRRALDVYTPSVAHAPVVVFFYGGGWSGGDRSMYRFVGQALAERGFVTVIPDYRVYPEVRYPTFIDDGADAVAWTKAHIAQYGGDPGRVFLMGHSAGAHIAAMLTLDKEFLARDGLDPDRDIAGMVGLSGPYDFLPLEDPLYKAIFAPAEDLTQTQPITYARAGAPPLFLATGGADTTVLPRNTQRLAARIVALGGHAEVRTYPGLGHSIMVGVLSGVLSWIAPVLNDTTAFLRSVSGPG